MKTLHSKTSTNIEYTGLEKIEHLVRIDCSLLYSGKQKRRMKYFYLASDPNNQKPICGVCIRECHEGEEYTESPEEEDKVCQCGLANHKMRNNEKERGFSGKCNFSELGGAYRSMYKSGGSHFCGFCVQNCGKTGEKQEESSDTPGCDCDEEFHKTKFGTYTKLVELLEKGEPFVEGMSHLQFVNCLFSNEVLRDNLTQNFKHRFDKLILSLEDEDTFTWDDNLKYSELFRIMSFLAKVAMKKGSSLATKGLSETFTPKKIFKLVRAPNTGDINTVFRLKQDALTCMYYFNCKKLLYRYPVLTIEDYENLSPVQRDTVARSITKDIDFSEAFLNGDSHFNFIDEVNSLMEKMSSFNEDVFIGFIPILELNVKIFRKLSYLNLVKENQKEKFCRVLESIIPKHDIQNLEEEHFIKFIKVFEYATDILVSFAFQYNDNSCRNYLLKKSTWPRYYHGKNEISKSTTKLALVISHTLINNAANNIGGSDDDPNSLHSKIKMKSQDNISKILKLFSFSIAYPDPYIFGIKRIITTDTENQIQLMKDDDQIGTPQLEFVNFCDSLAENLNSQLFKFANCKLEHSQFLGAIQDTVVQFFRKIGRENYMEGIESRMENLEILDGSQDNLEQVFGGEPTKVARARGSRQAVSIPYYDLLSKSALIHTLAKTFKIQKEYCVSTDKPVCFSSEAMKEIFRLFNYFIQNSPDNCIMLMNKKILHNMIQFVDWHFEELFSLTYTFFKVMEDNDYEVINISSTISLLKALIGAIEKDSKRNIFINKMIKIFDMMTNDFDSMNKTVLTDLKKIIQELKDNFKIIVNTMDFLNAHTALMKTPNLIPSDGEENLQAVRDSLVMNQSKMVDEVEVMNTETESKLEKMKAEFETDNDLSIEIGEKILTKYLKLLNDVFDGTGVLQESEFLFTFIPRDVLLKILSNTNVTVSLRTQIIRYFRMIYIDLSPSEEEMENYKANFIFDEEEANERKQKGGLKAQIYHFYGELSENTNMHQTFNAELNFIKNEITRIEEILNTVQVKNRSAEEISSEIEEYFEQGILVPVRVFYNKFMIILNYTPKNESHRKKKGMMSIYLYEITLLFLYMKAKIFEYIKQNFSYFTKKEIELDEEAKTKQMITNALNQEFKKSILAGKSKSYLFLNAEEITKQEQMLENDINLIESDSFEIFDSAKVSEVFQRNFINLIERPKTESLLNFFSKKVDFLEEKKKNIYASLEGCKLTEGQDDLIYMIMEYERKKQIIDNGSFLETLGDKNYAIEEEYRSFMVNIIHYIFNDDNLFEIHFKETLNFYLKLLQYDTENIQSEVIDSIELLSQAEKEYKATKKARADNKIDENELRDSLKIYLNKGENNDDGIEVLKGKDLIKYFANVFHEKLLAIIFYSYNPSSSSFNFDYYYATHMIKILKFYCEEHNPDFQNLIYNKSFFQLPDGKVYSLIDYLFFVQTKLIILAEWEAIEFDDDENKNAYYYDLFSTTNEFIIECIQGANYENLRNNFNDKTVFFSFLKYVKNFLFSDKFHNNLVYQVKADIMNLIMTIITEKNIDDDIVSDMAVELYPEKMLGSCLSSLKKLYIEMAEDGKNMEKYKKNKFDTKMYNFFLNKYRSSDFVSKQPEFKLATLMIRYVRVLASSLHNIKDAVGLSKLIEDYDDSDIYALLHPKPKLSRSTGKMVPQVVGKHTYKLAQNYYALKLFDDIIRVIKLKYEGEVIDVYFEVNPFCFKLSNNSKRTFEDEVNRESRFGKLFEMMTNCDYFFMEIFFNKKREEQLAVNKWFNQINYYSVILFLYILTVVINLFMLISYDEYTTEVRMNGDETWYPTITALSIVQVVINFVFMAIWLYSKYPMLVEIEMAKAAKAAGVSVDNLGWYTKTKIWLRSLVVTSDMISFAYIIVLGGIGLISPEYAYIYSFQLLSCINLTETLKNIIRAIITKADQFFITILFLLILIFAYSTIGFFFLNGEFDSTVDGKAENICSSAIRCFITHVYQGLRNGGGIGDILNLIEYNKTGLYWGRFFYDMMYYFMVIIIMLNILFGIIIDAYSELKEKTQDKLNDMKNICFVCGASRNDIEKEGTNFEHHVNKVHNMWNYVYYIIGLKFVDAQDLNAVDGFANDQIEDRKISWVPGYEGIEEEE